MTLISFRHFKQISEGYLRSYIQADGKLYKGDQGTAHADLVDKVMKMNGGKQPRHIKYGFIDNKGDFMNQRDKRTWKYVRDNNLLNNKAYNQWGKPPVVLSDILKKKHITDNSGETRRLNPKDFLNVR